MGLVSWISKHTPLEDTDWDFSDWLSGKKGIDTAAAGAKEAQSQANVLAQLQWDRQMQGLQEARGQTQPYLSLYDKIYGTQMAGNQTPVSGMSAPGAGGTRPPGPDHAGMQAPIMRTLHPPAGGTPAPNYNSIGRDLTNLIPPYNSRGMGQPSAVPMFGPPGTSNMVGRDLTAPVAPYNSRGMGQPQAVPVPQQDPYIELLRTWGR